MVATRERKRKAASGNEIVLSRQALKAALDCVSPAVPSRSVKPVYQNVLLSGGVLSGSDGEVRIDCAVENAHPGVNVLLPRDRLSAILSSASGDEVTLTLSDSTCVIHAGNGTWTIPTEDPSEYPAWEVEGEKPITRLPADQFVRAVSGVVFAVDDESSRYALGAVLLEVKGENVTFVATDGRRLSLVTCEHDQALDDRREPNYEGEQVKPPLLVPARVMAILRRLAAHAGNQAVQLEATKNELVATVGDVTVTARLLDGRFPRWRDVLPERDAKATTVDRAELAAATRAAAICTSDDSKGVTFAFSDSGIWLHGQSSERGESSVTCDVVEAGDTATVKVDPVFVTQWLSGIAADADPVVEVEVVDADSAVIMRCGDNTGVIMPLAKD